MYCSLGGQSCTVDGGVQSCTVVWGSVLYCGLGVSLVVYFKGGGVLYCRLGGQSCTHNCSLRGQLCTVVGGQSCTVV